MSVLIEALRSADAARAKTASAPSGAVAPDPLSRPAAGARSVRWIAIAAFAAVALAAAGAWLWLQTQAGTPPPADTASTEPAAPQAADTAPTEPAAPPPAADVELAQAPARAEAAAVQRRPAAATPVTPTARRVQRRPPSAPAAAAAATADAALAPTAMEVEKSPPPDLQAAYAALRAGRHEEASRLYGRLAQTHPYNADVLFGLAYLAEVRGDRAAAVTGYRRVLQADPDHADALAALAELTAGRDPAPQASVLRTALARRPDSPSLHAALGRLLASEGRWSEARQAFASALTLAPRRAEHAFNLAVALDHLGDVENARAAYLRAAELAAADPQPTIEAAAAARALALAGRAPAGKQP